MRGSQVKKKPRRVWDGTIEIIDMPVVILETANDHPTKSEWRAALKKAKVRK